MREPGTWWRRPELRDDRRRSVGWLELYFDLVFVVIVSRLAGFLAGHLTARGVAEFAIEFAGVFWIWNAFTYYTERFESDGMEDRAFTFLALLPVAALAVFANGGLAEHHQEFALAYLGARAVNMIGWIRAARNVPRFRRVAGRLIIGFVISAVLVLLSLRAGPDGRLMLWICVVIVDTLTPATTMRLEAELPPIGADRFPERFGLFTLLVLGASLVGVINAISALSDAGRLTDSMWATAPLGLAIGFGLWWMYFDFVARRPPRPVVSTVLSWIYLHLIATAMIAATGAGISVALIDDARGGLHPSSQRLIASGVGGALIVVALLETTLLRKKDEPTQQFLSPFLKIATGSLALLAGWAAEQWSATSLFVLLLTTLVIPCAYGAHVWYTQQLAEHGGETLPEPLPDEDLLSAPVPVSTSPSAELSGLKADSKPPRIIPAKDEGAPTPESADVTTTAAATTSKAGRRSRASKTKVSGSTATIEAPGGDTETAVLDLDPSPNVAPDDRPSEAADGPSDEAPHDAGTEDDVATAIDAGIEAGQDDHAEAQPGSEDLTADVDLTDAAGTTDTADEAMPRPSRSARSLRRRR